MRPPGVADHGWLLSTVWGHLDARVRRRWPVGVLQAGLGFRAIRVRDLPEMHGRPDGAGLGVGSWLLVDGGSGDGDAVEELGALLRVGALDE
jgi:hypothetical protein